MLLGTEIMRLMTFLCFSTKCKELQDFQILPSYCSAENLKSSFCRKESKNILRLVEMQCKVIKFGLSWFALGFF